MSSALMIITTPQKSARWLALASLAIERAAALQTMTTHTNRMTAFDPSALLLNPTAQIFV